MHPLEQLLAEEEIVLIDGAMGTELFARGLANGDSPELWNAEQPERVADVHQSYVQAGSQIVLTNSFGGTSFRLKLHDLDDRAYELNKAAAATARRVADDADHMVVVAGSMGPTGEILAPMGQMEYDDAVDAFATQAQGLIDGGADVLWIETMSDLNEVKAAVEGIRRVDAKRPICATMTFDTKGRTMMGITPQEAVRALNEFGVYAIGANCGNGTDEIEAVIHTMNGAAEDVILIAKSNAGIPQWLNDELVYSGTPAVMAAYAQRVRSLGARIIGGCCGSTPEHVTAMRRALAPGADTIDLSAEDVRGFVVADPADQPPADKNNGRRRRRRRRRA